MYYFHKTEKWIHNGWLDAWNTDYAPDEIIQIEDIMAEALFAGNGQGQPVKWDEETGCPYLGEAFVPIALTAEQVAAKQIEVRGRLLRARYLKELDPLTNEAVLKREAGLTEEADAIFAVAVALKAQIQAAIPLESVHITANGVVTVDTL